MKYKIDKNFHRSNNPYNWTHGCDQCKGKFGQEERFVRIDVQTNDFRGDDDVFCFHKGKCFEEGMVGLNKKY